MRRKGDAEIARPSKLWGLTTRDQVARVDIPRPNYAHQIKQRWTFFCCMEQSVIYEKCALLPISAWQTKHPTTISDTRIAQDSQNRACRHGASAKPTRGDTRHTWQQSSEVDAAAAVADSDAADVVAAGAWLASSSSSLLLLLSSRGYRASVWAPTECLTARRNCRRL